MSEELFQPAPHVLAGDTADVYFLRTRQVMEAEGLNPIATMEVFPRSDGLLCGMQEVEALLRQVLPKDAEVWAWFRSNRHWLEVHQLPPYSPELNPTERLWPQTRRTGTHSR